VLRRILTWANTQGLTPLGAIRSPITGPAGNVEFLAHLKRGASLDAADQIKVMASSCALDARDDVHENGAE
jgi:hypothetical protein